ncbi:hypothetical protein ACWDTT_15840 [Streptosporangium sandarakinum]
MNREQMLAAQGPVVKALNEAEVPTRYVQPATGKVGLDAYLDRGPLSIQVTADGYRLLRDRAFGTRQRVRQLAAAATLEGIVAEVKRVITTPEGEGR